MIVTDSIGANDGPHDFERHENLFPGRGLWSVLAVIAAVDIVWLATSDRLSLDLWSGRSIAPAVALLAILRVYCRSRSELRLRRLFLPLAGALFIILAFTALRVLDHLTMSIPFHYVDDGLAKLDAILGFDWLGYAEWVAGRPLVVKAFQLAYTGLTLVALAVFIILFAVRRIDRAKEFVRLIFWSGLAATIIGMFFPAKAAMDRFASLDLRAIFGPDAGVYHLPYFNVLRSNEPYVLNLQGLPGLVSMPSFHTACALLIMYSCRQIWVLQPLSILYAVVMIASTPIIGGHYFVDIIAGGFLTAIVIFADGRIGYSAGAPSPSGLPVSPVGLTTEPQ
jgi:membrane-associated phospholipid phosphatase